MADTPDISAALEAARQAADAAREQAAQWRDTAQRALAAASSNIAARQPDPEPEPDDEDLDPTVLKAVERRIAKLQQQFEQVYVRDRQNDLGYRAQLEFDRARQSLPAFSKYEAAIKDYMRDVPVHLQAAPGAIEEAYHVIVGRSYRQQLEQDIRHSQLATSTRSPVAPAATSLSDDDRQFLSRIGFDLTDEDFSALESRVTDIETYRKRTAK